MSVWADRSAANQCSWGGCANSATVEHTHTSNGELLWNTRPFCDGCAKTDRGFVASCNANGTGPIEITARPLDPERQILGEAIGLAFERLAVSP